MYIVLYAQYFITAVPRYIINKINTLEVCAQHFFQAGWKVKYRGPISP